MQNALRHSLVFIVLWLAHLMLDFMVGVWAVYKTIASLDILLAGLMASCAALIGESSQLYFGDLSDKGHHHKLVILGLCLTMTAPLFVYFNHPFLLFICLLSVMIGSGAFHPSGIKIIVAASEKRKNLLIAFFASGGMVGAALSQLVFVHVHTVFNGHTFILIIPLLLLAFLCFITKFPKNETKEKMSFKNSFRLLKPYRYELGLLYLIGVCLQSMVLSFSFLLPEVLQMKGYESWFCLGGGFFYFILGAALTSLPAGFFIDRFGYKAGLLVITICGGVLLNLLLRIETLSLTPIIILLILLGGTLGVTVPVLVAASNSVVPPKFSGLVSGIFIGGVSCVAGLSPLLCGILTSYVTKGSAVLTIELISFLSLISLTAIYLLVNQKSLPIVAADPVNNSSLSNEK